MAGSVEDAMAALGRLFDQAFNTAGDEAGRQRAGNDYATVAWWLGHVTPAEHRLSKGGACSCGKWKAKLGESIHRGFDRHLLEVRQ